MTPLFPYLSYWIKMVLLSGILLGYYRLFLRHTAAHAFNRYYLLAAVFLALQLPFLRLSLPAWTDPVDQVARTLARPHGPHTRAEVTEAYVRNYSDLRLTLMRHAPYIYMAYGLITLVFAWPLLRSLYAIRRLKRRYTPEQVADIFVYPTNEAGTPFSFFNHLFWNDAIPTDTEKGQLIFRHELYHIRQLHTVDILVLETFRRLFWCNPFFFFLLRELKLVHECLADRYALQSDTQRATYAEYLVWQSQGVAEVPHLVHSFYHTQLKSRVAMILHPAATHAGKLTRWLTLPLALFLLVAFTAKEKSPFRQSVIFDRDPILQNDQLTAFFRHRLRYPQSALERGMEGSVWCGITIDRNGTLKDAGYGMVPIDTRGGKIPTLTVTAKALNPDQQIAEPAVDTLKSIFVREVMAVANETSNEPVAGCPPGYYYFSIVFKIEK